MDMPLELVGVLGGILYFIAFFEVSIGKWNGFSYKYEFFNLAGAICLFYYSVEKTAYTNTVLNIIWVVVSLYGIHHILDRHKKRKINKKKRSK